MEDMMTDAPEPDTSHRRTHASPLAAAYLEIDLAREIEQLHREPEWTSGHNAKTLAKYRSFRIVLLALRSSARIPEHRTEGSISIQVVSGHVQVRAEGRTFDLPAGRMLTLDHDVRHDVEALEDSAVLLTIAWPER
jgi:quercetin dioxygenase-like cupin family protein